MNSGPGTIGGKVISGVDEAQVPVYRHKLQFIREVLKRVPKHAFIKMDGDEDSVFEKVNKNIVDSGLTSYTRLKREDEILMQGIRNDSQIQMTGAPGAEQLRFKNPLFHLGVYIETADDVVNALSKISPLDDHKTLRQCTNKVFRKKELFKPVDDAIYQCRAYGIFATKDDGSGERYVALYYRDQNKRCNHFQLSGTLSVKRGEMKVETTHDLRPEIRHMDALTIQGKTYRVNGDVEKASNPKDIKDIKRPHDVTRQYGLSSTSNELRPVYGSEYGNRRKYPILADSFFLDRPFEGVTDERAAAFKEGAPNDVRALWARTLQPALEKLERQQNLADRMADRPGVKKKRKRARRRKKPAGS